MFDPEFAVGRRAVMLGGAAFLACGASAPPPRVLFICQAGTVKSAIAREVFRRRAAERGIAVSVFSRGITVEDHVSPGLRAHLNAEQIDPGHDPAQVLAAGDLRTADVIVVFDHLPPRFGKAAVRDWTALPSMNDAYSAAWGDLQKRVDALLDELARKKRTAR